MRKNRFGVVFVLLASLLLLFACSSKQEKVTAFLARGDRLLAESDPVKAVLEYKCALQIDIKNVKATLGLGRAYLAEEDFQRALGAFKSALELDPGCNEARVQLARLLVMGGQGQAALDDLKKLKDTQKYEPAADIIKARALAGLKRYKESIGVLTKTKGIEGSKEGQMLLAYCLRATGSAGAMKKAIAQWRKLDPKDPSSYLFLAQYFMEKGEKANAISELKAMLDINPRDEKRDLLWAQSLEALGFIKEAEAAFESLKGGNEILSAQADFWIRRKDAAKAGLLFEKIVENDPKNIGAVTKLAAIYEDQLEFPKVLDILDRTLEENLKKPDRAKVLLAKAALEARERNFSSAERICKAVLGENQNNLDAHLLLGEILLSLRKPFDAELHLNQVAAARPNDEEAQVLLAESQLENKNDSIAGDTLRNALATNPRSLKLRTELVRYYLGGHQDDQARQVLDKGILLHPGNITLLKMRGELEASRKNWDGAEKDFRNIIALHPKSLLGYLEIGRLMFSQSKPDEAAKWFEKMAGLENGWKEAVPALFVAYMAKGDQTAALNAVKTEVEKRKDSPVANFLLGQAYQKTGDLADAEKAYDKASELAPKWPDPYGALASVYSQKGELSDAITRTEKAWKANPTVVLRVQLAIFYEQAGRNSDAINAYNDLLKRLGRRPGIMNNLAYLYAESTGDKDKLAKAGEFIKAALIQEPENPRFLDTAAWVAYKQGDLGNAWNYAQDALANSKRAVYSLHAAIILNARGEKKQALKYLNDAIESKSDKLDKKAMESANRLKKEWSGS